MSRARRPLEVVVILTGILVLPLGISLVKLVRQQQLEENVRRALIEDSVTFENLNMELVSSRTNWQVSPPRVYMMVNASELITPKQVGLLEDYIEQRMNQPFEFVFRVSEVKDVTEESSLPGTQIELLPKQVSAD